MEAISRGTDHLLISSEELSRITASEGARLRDLLQADYVAILLTITRPVHRWYSAWQELVKNGLAETPADAADDVRVMTVLGQGSLEALLRAIPADRIVVRIVRTEPHELDLPDQVSSALGIDFSASSNVEMPKNTSLGANIELLRRLNAAHESIEIDRAALEAKLRDITQQGPTNHYEFSVQGGYELPANFAEAARSEQLLLQQLADTSVIELHDPHNQLVSWDDLTPPSWVEEIAAQPWPIVADPTLSPEELAWRARIVLASAKADNARALHAAKLQTVTLNEALVRANKETHAAKLQSATLNEALVRANEEMHSAMVSYETLRDQRTQISILQTSTEAAFDELQGKLRELQSYATQLEAESATAHRQVAELRPFSERPSLAARVFLRGLWPALRTRLLSRPRS